ncbi:IS3 family transposase [Escherichia coli]|uniref:IS3 family transposase n=1 Tax=Escherichia coli TaxID=562 RepID=UPI003F7AE6FB
MFPGQCGNTAFFFKSQPDQFHFEFRGIVFPGKSFFSAHEVSTCKISGCLSYRILDSGPDGTQTTLTDEGWLYLAVVIDLWSRAVIGWSMSPRMTAQLACDALQMALWRRKRPRNVIVHTDRGGQYCSADYQAQLKRHNLRGSMSAKGCCYDNACVESFFHSLKVECIHGEHFISREIMRATVFNYIECDYNRWRRHSWCGGLSPEQFENQNLA